MLVNYRDNLSNISIALHSFSFSSFSKTMLHCWVQIAFTDKKAFGREEREAAWAAERWTRRVGVPGVRKSIDMKGLFSERNSFRDLNIMAEEAKRRAEIARFITLIDTPKINILIY